MSELWGAEGRRSSIPGRRTDIDNLGNGYRRTGVKTMICIAKTAPKPDCLFAYTGRPFDKEVGLQFNDIRHSRILIL